ncbi:MAG: tetratricopeptide repeat protein [Melioribacteraceae bacterium]|nr:tetratricopeptide repeat protein [Melioribacteraceae bacterium]MCF8356146.1 tetratricopeptide repeat protein [Melioribacteraceae bacterium]MCF8395624.1 tetratricopeptide repeat protein [Melioribacteraceae bacterium]
MKIKNSYHIVFVLCIFFISLSLYAQDQTKELKREAKSHMDAGRYGEAIDLLNKYISANPQEPEGYFMRATSFASRSQYSGAVLDLRRAKALEKTGTEFYKEISRELERVQEIWYEQLRKKIKGHEREIAIDPYNPFNYLEIGKSYRWLEIWDYAEEWYDKYLERDKNASPDEIIRYTEILAKTEHIQKGEKILKEYVERYPDDWRLWSRYGTFTLWLGKRKIAEEAFLNALEIKPFFKEAQDGLDKVRNQAYVTQYEPQARERVYMVDVYVQRLKNNPDDDATRFKLVDELIEEKRIEEAYQQLLILEPGYYDDSNFQEKWNYVVDYRETVYRAEIDKNLPQLEGDPANKQVVKDVAQYYEYLQEYDNALNVLENYFAQVPDEKDPDMRYQYAKIAAWGNRFDDAIVYIDGLIEEYPENIDYQLLRGQIGVWSGSDFELSEVYLQNAVEQRPNSIPALVGLSSVLLKEEDFVGAREYANRALELRPEDNDIIDLITQIDFQEERARLAALLNQARSYAISGDYESAIPYYQEYISQEVPTDVILKEYGDAYFALEKYDEALDVYNQILDRGFFYDAALERAKIYYVKGDSVQALSEFKNLVEIDSTEFLATLFLGDAYAKMGYNDSANTVYDNLLTWDIDSTKIGYILQRKSWIPPTGFEAIFLNFPSAVSFAPALSFYSDNVGFSFVKLGGRIDLGVTSWLTIGASFFRNNLTGIGQRAFSSLKGHLFFNIAENLRAGAGYGSTSSFGIPVQPEIEAFVNYDVEGKFKLLGAYQRTDAAILLYSKYLINLLNRNYSDMYKLDAFYKHKSGFEFSGYFQYVDVSDGNEGNDLQARIGNEFFPDITIGYEYYYTNYKYLSRTLYNSTQVLNIDLTTTDPYYSPQGFESHSLFAQWQLEETDDLNFLAGGKIGYVPQTDFLIIQGQLKVTYKAADRLTIAGELSGGSTSRDNSSYRYVSGAISAYWGIL